MARSPSDDVAIDASTAEYEWDGAHRALGLQIKPGGMLGQFEITACLGEGGMGRVFEGFDTILKRRVAIKIPKDDVLASPELRNWFLQEGVSQARVKDPRVAQILQSKEIGEIPCHIMEFVEGDSLATLLDGGRRLPAHRSVCIARDIALGLREIHLHSRIHGDIKPSNVLIDREHAKLIDFGMSREVIAAARHSVSKGGTGDYQAPEAKRGDASGVSEDIYSLGCVLFEMLTGHKFSESLVTTSVSENVGEPAALASTHYADVPRSLRRLVASLTAVERRDRPDSAKEVSQRLDEWLDRPRRRATRAVILVVVLVALLYAGHGFWQPGQVARLASNGKVVARHRTLDAALSALQDGEILELRSDGPFSLTTHVNTPRDVTIRGAPDTLPVVELAPLAGGAPHLTCRGGLTLDNVVIRGRIADSDAAYVLISCAGPWLRVKNCLWDLESSTVPQRVIGCEFTVARRPVRNPCDAKMLVP